MIESFQAWLKKVTPPNTRLIVTHNVTTEIHVVCAGSDALFAYYCILEPGHEGRCYSIEKQVEFTPVPLT